jgi:hypothetical protein
LFLFNLFTPAYPLDGGRILAALLVKCGVKVNTAAYVTSITALLLAAGMVVWGLYVFLLDDTDGGAPIFLFLIAAFIAIHSFSLLTKARPGKARPWSMRSLPRNATNVPTMTRRPIGRLDESSRHKRDRPRLLLPPSLRLRLMFPPTIHPGKRKW